MICRYCGCEFEPKKRGRKITGFCCKHCADNWRRHNVYDLQPNDVFCSEACRHRSKRDREQDKRRRRRAMTDDHKESKLSLDKVYPDAEGQCSVCGLPVPIACDCNDVWSRTRDHIIPITLQGAHTYGKFASIYDHVEDPNILEAFKDPAWAFNYDLFEGQGEITHGTGVHLGTWSDESTQIDKLQMDADLIVYVYADEEGVINLVPAFKVSSTGSYRPYVEGIAVKGEEEVTNLSVLACDGQIEGTQLSEVAIVPLTGDEDLEEGTRALLRIKGASRDYELEFDVSADVAAVVDAY